MIHTDSCPPSSEKKGKKDRLDPSCVPQGIARDQGAVHDGPRPEHDAVEPHRPPVHGEHRGGGPVLAQLRYVVAEVDVMDEDVEDVVVEVEEVATRSHKVSTSKTRTPSLHCRVSVIYEFALRAIRGR